MFLVSKVPKELEYQELLLNVNVIGRNESNRLLKCTRGIQGYKMFGPYIELGVESHFIKFLFM